MMSKTRIRSNAAATSLMAAALILAGCATTSTQGVLSLVELSERLEERGVDAYHLVVPYLVSEEMERWARDVTRGPLNAEEKLIKLQLALLDPSAMQVRYQWGYTGTAVEVFEQRVANCLAFTNLFVGMARVLDVPVYFLGVSDNESFRREGDLIIISDHIAVGYGRLSERQIFDFSENPPDDYHGFQEISDLTAIAMFHSNRGAEILQTGNAGIAKQWLELAVQIDPELANAWVNLGVARRRAGDNDGAEQAYRQALTIDPRTQSAYQNLVSLLRIQGRHDEATAYQEALASTPTRNPYTYLSLGDLSLMSGRRDEAAIFYQKAVRLNPDDPEPYAALGQVALDTGDVKRARRMLKKARKMGVHPRANRLETNLRIQ